MERKGTWYLLYVVLMFLFALGFLVFGGSAHSASKADRELFNIVSFVSLILLGASAVFLILATVNGYFVRKSYEGILTEQSEKCRIERDLTAVLMYDLACEFLSRFAEHYVEVAANHPDKAGNRRNFWLVVAFVSSIINRLQELGHQNRADSLVRQLNKLLDSKLADIDNGGQWAELKNAAISGLGRKIDIKKIAAEYHALLLTTRLGEYVITY